MVVVEVLVVVVVVVEVLVVVEVVVEVELVVTKVSSNLFQTGALPEVFC